MKRILGLTTYHMLCSKIKTMPFFVLLSLLSCNNNTNRNKDVIEQPEKVYKSIDYPEKSNSQKDNDITKSESVNKPTAIQKLKQAFASKDELLFLNLFPSDFHQFLNYFGWNNESGQPNELYEESYAYIDYFFELIAQDDYKIFENKLISIAKNGRWQEDGVNYFQDLALAYIKNGEHYDLINELTSDDAKSVLFFFFDGPHPKLDTNFASHLSPSKKEILEELFEIDFFDKNENPDPTNHESIDPPKPVDHENPYPIDYEGSIHYTVSDFETNEHYFIREIDINNDLFPDKVISAGKYQGDELYLFINTGNEYTFVLKTTNFSEDGGNQIVDVIPEEGGFVIKTVFPDGGLNEAYHHIIFDNDRWLLNNTVYKTKSSNQEDAFIYICDVPQELDLEDTNALDKLKSIPEEAERNRLCTKEIN